MVLWGAQREAALPVWRQAKRASAIDTSDPSSEAFLQALSQQLCIPRELVESIHQQLAQY